MYGSDRSSRCRFAAMFGVLRIVSLPLRRGPAAEARACYEELGVDGAAPPA